MHRPAPGFFLPWVFAALLIASACGGDDDSDGSSKNGAATTGATEAVKVATVAGKGSVLTDSSGLTLYVFDGDKAGKSSCTGTCAGTWPPLMATGSAKPGGLPTGLDVIARDDGAQQVTFNGRPLYRYSGDKGPSEASGDGVGGVWHVATQAAAAASATVSGAGSGYNY